MRLVPVVPPCLQDVVPQLTLYKDCLGEWSPRPSEIDLRGRSVMIQTAVSEHIAIFLSLRCGSGCYITVLLAQYIAVLEPGRGKSENEVSRPFDMAVAEILALAGAECIDGILVCDETAVYERHTITVHRDGAGLCHFPGASCSILESQVLGQEVIRMKEYGRCGGSTHGIACGTCLGSVISPSAHVMTVFTASSPIRWSFSLLAGMVTFSS